VERRTHRGSKPDNISFALFIIVITYIAVYDTLDTTKAAIDWNFFAAGEKVSCLLSSPTPVFHFSFHRIPVTLSP